MTNRIMQTISLVDNKNKSDDLAAVFDSCARDTAVKNAVEQDCIVDSVILRDCKNAPSIKNLTTQDEWNRLIDDALALKNVRYRFKRAAVPMTKRVKSLAAACVALAAGGLLINLMHSPVTKMFSTADNSPVTSFTDTSAGTASRILSRSDIMTSDSQSSIVMFDKKTAGVVGNKSHMIVEKKDTAVYLSLTSGAVLFTVEKGRYRSFTVVTPHAKIRVTGTTFRVDALQTMTKVTVVEGSVKVIHESGIRHDTVALVDGNIAVADSVSIREFESERELEHVFPVRKLLDNFVKSSMAVEAGSDTPIPEYLADKILMMVRKKRVPDLNEYIVLSAANTLKTVKRYDDAILLYEYVLDNCEDSLSREDAACYLTWSLIQKKTDTNNRSPEKLTKVLNSFGDEQINLIRLYPEVQSKP